MKRLNKMNVLVTRPDPGGTALCKLITDAGGQAHHLPTIAIESMSHSEVFRDQVKALSDQDWLIFISPQAVLAAWPVIKAVYDRLPEHLGIAAIGPGTANALAAEGVQGIVCPKEHFCSEGLLALPAFQSVKGKKMSIIRGNAGRDVLEKTLQSRGAVVMPVIAYQRVLPHVDVVPFLVLMQKNAIDVIVCGSYETVNNLKILFGDCYWPIVNRIPLLVVSSRIEELARQLGFRTIWVARNASHEAILETLAKKGKHDGR